MATDGPTPPPCARDIYEKGTAVVLLGESIGSNAIENWVKGVAELSGQPVDWHFVGGRAVVLALGDLDKVAEALDVKLPEYKDLYTEYLVKNYSSWMSREEAERQTPYKRYI